MSEIAKCPCCGNDLDYYVSAVEGDDEPIWYECMSRSCMFSCNGQDLPRISAAMELAKVTCTLESAMKPLNAGKVTIGAVLPAIRLVMEDHTACEQRVLEVFK